MSEDTATPPDECLLVLTNFPNAEIARQIGTSLVEQQLAACVNIASAPFESIYQWEGKMEQESEFPAFLKTTRGKFPALRDALAKAHPYEVPEIIALPITDGLPAYLNWVRRG